MRKIFLFSSFVLLGVSLLLFSFIELNISNNIKKNNNVVNEINSLFNNFVEEFNNPKYETNPSLEINEVDYIGYISIPLFNINIPVDNSCERFMFEIKSLCEVSSETFTIMGTNLRDSFKDYKKFDDNLEIDFISVNGKKNVYFVDSINRIKDLSKINKYNSDIKIVIKNYYNSEYILILGNAK